MSRTARFPRQTWLAIGAVAAAAGCAPITTQLPYSASDGVRVELGEQVKAENLMIVTSAEGAPGVLLGGLTNLGEQPAEVSVQVGVQVVDLPIEPGQTVLLGADPGAQDGSAAVAEVSIAAVPAPPGGTTDVEIATPGSGAVAVSVPVLDGTLQPYDQVVP